MRKIFKNLFAFIFSVIMLFGLIVVLYIFKGQVVLQAKHAAAYYYVSIGDKEYRKGAYQKAIDNYKKGLNLYPEHANAQYNLGNIYVAYEDYGSAVECYQNAIKASPNFINARINLGIVLAQEMSNPDGAIEQYNRAVHAKPFILNIPFIYDKEKEVRFARSIAYYDMGLVYQTMALRNSTDIFASSKYYMNAVNSYKNSLKLEPGNFDTHYNLALALHALGRYIEASEEYCRAINLSPLSYEAHYNLAILLRKKLKYKNSLAELQKAGLILDSYGEGNKARYIYDLYGDVSKRVLAEHNNDENKINDENNKSGEDKSPDPADEKYNASVYDTNITYLNGKVVLSEKSDKAIMNNFKACIVCETEGDTRK